MIRVVDNGLHIEEGVLRYAWFRLETAEGEKYRCVALRELASVPYDVREGVDTLGRQWAALRGLYNAGVDYVYTALGIFHPEHVGVVQLYGAAGEGTNRETAAGMALEGLAAVEAALANFPQSQTRPPDLRWIEWYLEFVTKRAKNVLALLGHPDPRASKRGLGADGNLPDYAEDDLAEEQNEILFRGLAKLRQDFVFQVTAAHVDRRRLSRALVDVARVASNFASRRRGSVNIGFSLGIPLMAALGQAVSGGQGGTQALAHSTAQGVTQGWGEAHSDSHAVGRSEAWTSGGSETHIVGVSQAQAESEGQGYTRSSADTQSWAHTVSHSVTESTAVSHSQGSGSSWMSGGGVMQGVSGGSTLTHSVSDGTATSSAVAHGVSQSEALSHGGSLSTGYTADAKILGVGIGGGQTVSETVGLTQTSGNTLTTTSGVTQSHTSGWSAGESSGWNAGSVRRGRAVVRRLRARPRRAGTPRRTGRRTPRAARTRRGKRGA